MKFGNWDEKIHCEKDQITRYSRACSSDKKFSRIDRQNQTGEFVGSEGDLYYVTLNDCSCQDFKKRGKPCKHIYQLALELGYAKEDKSTKTKLKDLLKTTYGKIGFALIILGAVSADIILVVIGIWLLKKKAEPSVKDSESVQVSNFNNEEDLPDFTPLPLDIPHSSYKPSEKQLNYAEDLGIKVLDTYSFDEVSSMISRIESNDLNRPSLELAQYALDVGAKITPYIGANSIIGYINNKLTVSGKIAFYAYAVHCSLADDELGDPRKSPYYNKFTEFGKNNAENDKLVKSIENRPFSDYYKPNRNTAAYKTVMEMLKSA